MQKEKREELIDFLLKTLTSELFNSSPLSFYPGSVLGIINDLTEGHTRK
jgi:phosphoenolpyruvate carboxylase